jgi:membrane protease YdiL (CAAX protease family)
MSASRHSGGRLRAYLIFLAALLYYFVARSLAHRAALGFTSDAWFPLIEQTMLVFLLLVVYGIMGFWIDHQLDPISQQGLDRRKGWLRESGLGLSTGWSLAVVCILPMLLAGGIAVYFSAQTSSWGWLLADAAYFALATLAEEVAFRGYAFQCFVRAVGPLGASFGFAAIYAIIQQLVPGRSTASFFVAFAFTLLLSSAYLRTRALWVSWGLNFGWKASRALLFGLAVNGVSTHSPIVQSDPMGPFWLTGGAFGLEGSWLAFFVLLAAIPVVFRITRDLNYRYNAPIIIPGGIPVDIDAAARAQHDAAMATPAAAAPQPPQFVQIAQIGSNSSSSEAPARVPLDSDPNHP